MAKTQKFQMWARVQAAKLSGQKTPEEIVDDMMAPKNLKIEYRDQSGWKECDDGKERVRP